MPDGARADPGRRPVRRSGLVGVLVRRNIIFMLLSVEIMLNAAGLAFVVAGARWGQPDGQVMFIFILTMAAAEVSVGLALVLQLHRQLQDARRRRAPSRMRGLDDARAALARSRPCRSPGFLLLALFGRRLPRRGRRAASASARSGLSAVVALR